VNTIRKSIVTDEAMRPIAVQIDYADWQEIERSLGLESGNPKVVDLSRFAGTVHLTVDPLEFQTRIREEWR
jgi:hypothetical protein